MRNAAANFDDDFASEAPVRKKPARKPAGGKATAGRSRGKKGKGRFRFALDMNRVARWSAIGMSATVALGIMVNALMMQTGHHPAPLFGKSIALGEPAAAPSAPAATRAPAKPAVALRQPVDAPLPVAKPVAPAANEDAATGDDPIGRLLSGAAPGGDHAETKTVLGAQRALIQLGFAVKATGTLGPQTKKAIEAFEKSRHLPVKGELSRRVVKLLAAESGLKVER